jgi:multidrug transporter EmrE-like cation transporter
MRLLDHAYILGTVLFTVYGQIILKWQVLQAGPPPVDPPARFWYFVRVVANPWVISSLCAAFLAFLFWVAAMTKFELSYAYPFTSLAFGLVLVCSVMFFGEALTPGKIAGFVLIALGILASSRG